MTLHNMQHKFPTNEDRAHICTQRCILRVFSIHAYYICKNACTDTHDLGNFSLIENILDLRDHVFTSSFYTRGNGGFERLCDLSTSPCESKTKKQ